MPLPMPISPARPVEHDGADRDVELSVARGRDIADRAAIDAARLAFQFADDLHGANLGRTGDRAARKQRAQHVLEPHVGPQLGDDAGRHLVHRAVGLDREQVGHLDAADPATRLRSLRRRSTIIRFSARCFSSTASQVLRRSSSRGVRPARRRALHRPRRDVLAFAAEEEFGRERKHVERASANQGAVGHALLAPERRIKRRSRSPAKSKRYFSVRLI